MRSFEEWRIKEDTQNAEWDRIKMMRFPISPDIKAFITPRVGKLQEAVVARLNEQNPKIKSFREVPPEVRDQFAQAIVSATLELFFSSMDPQSSSPGQPPAQVPKQPQPPSMLPQDDIEAPSGSRG